MLTVVIPFFNGHETIEKLLQSIPSDLKVLIVDDLSDRAFTVPYQENIQVIRLEKKGYFSGAVNAGIRECATDVLVLNQDVRLSGDAWRKVIEKQRAQYALIGERIAGEHPAWPHGYIQGTFMWIRRDLINRIGYFNETEYPLWGTTADYQARACRAGFSVLPIEKVPGFTHARHGKFGAGITTLLKREPEHSAWFIRTPPEVSVIVPCYNYGRYLKDLRASLFGGASSLGERQPQTFQSFEIIIVDDASTDNSGALADDLNNDWQGVHVIHLPKRRGTAGAVNAGISQSHSKYLTILSADDMREPDSLEYLYRAQLANPHSLIYDNVMPFGEGRLKPELKIGVSAYDFEKLLFKNHVHAGIMFPRAAWTEVGGYPEIMSDGREDWAMNVRLGVAGYCGVFINKPGYLYRREGQNRSLTNTNPRRREEFLTKIASLYPAIYQGERPNMCCGHGSRKIIGGVMSVVSKKSVPLDQGGLLLEYIGKSYGALTWYGPATGAQYRSGLSKKLVLVDPRDAYTGITRKPGLLELVENGKHLFRKYVAPAPVVVSAAPEIPVASEILEIPPSTEQSETKSDLAEIVANTGVREIRTKEFTPEEARAWLEAEQAGKARKSVIGHLEGLIGG